MDVLTAYKDASSSGAAYPPHPTKWIPDEDATAEDLIHDRKTILNLPPEVISVLSHAVGRLEDKLEEFPSNEFLTMLQELGSYFTAKKYESLPICKEKAVKDGVAYLETFYFVRERVLGITLDDAAADVANQLRDRCAELCLSMEEMNAIRTYVGKS
ncbi:unnamed protein product [Durusdinium trenchii]|uniref:Uncharacterized protein n=1 Tax=Durusdinium trenchii TaxID=1381693 RepID=A0ABP0SZT7_9DINO